LLPAPSFSFLSLPFPSVSFFRFLPLTCEVFSITLSRNFRMLTVLSIAAASFAASAGTANRNSDPCEMLSAGQGGPQDVDRVSVGYVYRF